MSLLCTTQYSYLIVNHHVERKIIQHAFSYETMAIPLVRFSIHLMHRNFVLVTFFGARATGWLLTALDPSRKAAEAPGPELETLASALVGQ